MLLSEAVKQEVLPLILAAFSDIGLLVPLIRVPSLNITLPLIPQPVEK